MPTLQPRYRQDTLSFSFNLLQSVTDVVHAHVYKH